MKAVVDTRLLRQAVRLAAPMASRSGTLPAARTLRMTANGKLLVEATNLEQSICLPVPAQVDTEGACCVPARWFARFLRTVSAETVLLNWKKGTLTVQADGITAGIRTLDVAEFPPVPGPDDRFHRPIGLLTLDAGDFRELARRTLYAASRDDARPVLEVVSFRVEGSELVAVATDGWRIAQCRLGRFTVSCPDTGSLVPDTLEPLLIPARALEHALCRLPMANGRTLTIEWAQAAARITVEGNCTILNLVTGNFPNTQAILPRQHAIQLKAGRRRLLEMARAAAQFSAAECVIGRISLQVAANQLELKVTDDEIGDLNQTMPVAIDRFPPDETDPFRMAFNARFLAEVLERMPGELVTVRFNKPNTPAVLEAGECLAVIMPMHVG